MTWSRLLPLVTLCLTVAASAQAPGEKGKVLAGWPGVWPELPGYQRTFTVPVVVEGKLPTRYEQTVKYEWTGGAIRLLEATLARDPDFKERHSADALKKDPGRPQPVQVGKHDAWRWEVAKEGDKAPWPVQGRLVIPLGADRALILVARGQGPWPPLEEIAKGFDLEKMATALDAAPRTDFRRTPEAFRALRKGMSYAEVTAWVGPADEDIGSGIHVMLYRLEGGGRVLLGFPDFSRLIYARLQAGDRNEDMLK